MNFSTNEKAIICDKPTAGQICIEEELLFTETDASPSESEQLCNSKCSEYAFSEDENSINADFDANEILKLQEYGTFEDEDSEEALEEFDLDEYEFVPSEGIEICTDCSECELFENCYPLRKRRKRR